MREMQPLTSTLEDYLEAVFVLSSDSKGARVDDIAAHVGVHKSTVTAALHALSGRGLVDYVPYRPVSLTSRGRRLGATIRGRHKTLRRFLTDVLGIEGALAEDTACRMEHVVPPEVVERFTSFTDFVEACPHASGRFSEGSGFSCEDGSCDGCGEGRA